MDQIRILIADDHAILRSGLRLLLEKQPDMQVVGEAESGEQGAVMTHAVQVQCLETVLRKGYRGGGHADGG